MTGGASKPEDDEASGLLDCLRLLLATDEADDDELDDTDAQPDEIVEESSDCGCSGAGAGQSRVFASGLPELPS